MYQYRIYTERKNTKWICKIVSEKFAGFTVYQTIGYWQGKREHSLCIEIISENAGTEHYIRQICLKIKGYNRQESVMYTKTQINMEFIS